MSGCGTCKHPRPHASLCSRPRPGPPPGCLALSWKKPSWASSRGPSGCSSTPSVWSSRHCTGSDGGGGGGRISEGRERAWREPTCRRGQPRDKRAAHRQTGTCHPLGRPTHLQLPHGAQVAPVHQHLARLGDGHQACSQVGHRTKVVGASCAWGWQRRRLVDWAGDDTAPVRSGHRSKLAVRGAGGHGRRGAQRGACARARTSVERGLGGGHAIRDADLDSQTPPEQRVRF